MSLWRFRLGPRAFSAQASIAPAEPAGELFCFAEYIFWQDPPIFVRIWEEEEREINHPTPYRRTAPNV